MLFYSCYKINALKDLKMNEKEKMLAGKIYDSMYPELNERRLKTSELCIKYNNMPEGHPEKHKLLKEIFPNADDSVFVRGPVYVDYGTFTKIGKNCYFNFNLVILDVCPVTIGDYCHFGPNVSIVTALHSLIGKEREQFFDEEKGHRTDYEYGKPITIGNNCWICSNVTILPGVTIGDNVVVGAGSVVTHDLKSGAVYVGNPAHKLRKIKDKESIFKKKELW